MVSKRSSASHNTVFTLQVYRPLVASCLIVEEAQTTNAPAKDISKAGAFREYNNVICKPSKNKLKTEPEQLFEQFEGVSLNEKGKATRLSFLSYSMY